MCDPFGGGFEKGFFKKQFYVFKTGPVAPAAQTPGSSRSLRTFFGLLII
jgi:hypothetical protein